jgi:hypothetical protein
MILSHTPGIIKRFRRTQWKFQQTFLTPLQEASTLRRHILAGIEDLRGGTVNDRPGYWIRPAPSGSPAAKAWHPLADC